MYENKTWAQNSKSQKVEIQKVQVVDESVVAQVRVLDVRNNEARSGLKAENFSVQISDNATDLLKVEPVFSSDGSLSVVVCVDTSGSMKRRWKATQQIVAQLVAGLSTRDQVAVVAFDVTAQVRLHFTRNKTVVSSVLSRLRPTGSETALFDGLDTSRDLFSNARVAPLRRVIVLLSDGADNASTLQQRDVASLANTRELPSVLVLDVGASPESRAVLNQISQTTGGRVLTLSDSMQTATTLQILRDQASDAYRLTFAAPKRGSGLHKIDVDLREGRNRSRATASFLAAPLAPAEVAAQQKSATSRVAWLLFPAVLFVVASIFGLQRRLSPHKSIEYLKAEYSDNGKNRAIIAENENAVRLLVVEGPMKGQDFNISEADLMRGAVLGRGENAQIRISDAEMSRAHVRLWHSSEGLCRVQDLDSTNGIFVNGQKVHDAVLSNGDRIKIGVSAFEFRAKNQVDKSQSLTT